MNFDTIKKLWKARSLWGGIKDLNASGYSWSNSGKKAAIGFAIVCSAVAVGAIAEYFSVPANLALLFAWLPESIRAAAEGLFVPILTGGVIFLRDWAKHRLNTVQWVLPIHEPTESQKTGAILPDPILSAVPVPLSVKPGDLAKPPTPPPPAVATLE